MVQSRMSGSVVRSWVFELKIRSETPMSEFRMSQGSTGDTGVRGPDGVLCLVGFRVSQVYWGPKIVRG